MKYWASYYELSTDAAQPIIFNFNLKRIMTVQQAGELTEILKNVGVIDK